MRAGLRVASGYSVAKAEARHLHDVRDGAVHGESGTGQARSAGETHAAIRVKLDVDFAQPVGPGEQPAGMTASVTSSDRSRPLARSATFRNAGRKMESVHDEAGRQAVVGELIPDVIRMAWAGRHGRRCRDAWRASRRR